MALEIEDLKSEVSARNPGTEDLPPGEGTIGISLIDLAEILDQHKTWVETGGESGAKADLSGVNLAKADLTGVNLQGAHLHRTNLVGADLSMANLRGASLVRADMRNANLLGTELRGANLMGANAYGVDGLWFGRLGGTNLFDAVLPESISAVDTSKAIGDATKDARGFYFLTVFASLISCLLIAFTTDVRLLLNSSALPFLRLGNVLPMTGLYLGGPLVLLALSLRFHFLLLRLWGSMAALPAVFPDGQTLERDGPWYLMGLVRRHFRWQGDTKSPMTAFETVLSTVLAYWIVPVTLFFFWVRYLARQDFRVCRFARAKAGGFAAAKIKKCSSPCSADFAGVSRRRLPPVSAFDRRQSRIALRPKRGLERLSRRRAAVGLDGFSVGWLPALLGFDGGDALFGASARNRVDGRNRGENLRGAIESNEFAFCACLQGIPHQCEAVAREPGRGVFLRSGSARGEPSGNPAALRGIRSRAGGARSAGIRERNGRELCRSRSARCGLVVRDV